MKSLLLVTTFAFLAMTSIAQVRLTQADYTRFFNSKSVDNYTAVLSENATMQVGTEGTGNTYDLNAFTFEKEPADCNFVEPAGTPFANRFPDATHAYCQKYDNSTTLTFYTLAEDALYLEGNARVIDGMPFVYSSGLHRPVLEFPAQYGTSWSYEGEIYEASPGNSLQTITHYMVDANGTMNIGFEVQPCMRMKVVEELIRTNTVGGANSRSVQRSVSYVFMTNQGLTATAVIDTLDAHLPNPRISSLTYTVYNAGPVSVGTVDAAATLTLAQNYPNPVSGQSAYQTNVEWAVTNTAQVHLAVYDVTGRERLLLHDGIAAPGVHTSAVDASSLTPGTYFVQLRNGAEIRSQMMSVVK